MMSFEIINTVIHMLWEVQTVSLEVAMYILYCEKYNSSSRQCDRYKFSTVVQYEVVNLLIIACDM